MTEPQQGSTALSTEREHDLVIIVGRFLDGNDAVMASSRLSRAIKLADAITDVTNPDDYQRAHELVGAVRARAADIEKLFSDAAAPFNKAHKTITSARATHTSRAQRAEIRLFNLAQGWKTNQERQAAEERARQRRAVEQQQREVREAEAQQMEAQGAPEEAQQHREGPLPPPAAPSQPELVPAVPKDTGVTTQRRWKARVTDIQKLAAAVGRGDVPVTALKADQAYLNKRATADKDLLNMPGVEAYYEDSPVVRRGNRAQ